MKIEALCLPCGFRLQVDSKEERPDGKKPPRLVYRKEQQACVLGVSRHEGGGGLSVYSRVYKALHGQEPSYLEDLMVSYLQQ